MTSPTSVVETTVDRLAKDCEQALSDCITSDKPLLRKAWAHQLSARGKRLRLRLSLYTSLTMGIEEEQCKRLACACEIVHQASLVHDDLMDSDSNRNGQPTVWKRFGAETAVCLGDALIVEALFQLSCIPRISSSQIHALSTVFRDSIQAASEGQVVDCDTMLLDRVSYNDYTAAVRKKSGTLLGLPVLASMILNGYQKADLLSVNDAFSELGVVYQLMDDVDDKEADKGHRLNGYWVLFRSHPNEAMVALKNKISEHLKNSEERLSGYPSEIKISFNFIKTAMLEKHTHLAVAS